MLWINAELSLRPVNLYTVLCLIVVQFVFQATLILLINLVPIFGTDLKLTGSEWVRAYVCVHLCSGAVGVGVVIF